MTRRASIWWAAAAALFTVANIGGAIMAAAMGEGPHAGGHVALAVLGVLFVRRLAASRSADRGPVLEASARAALPNAAPDRLSSLEQSIDAVAIDVERMGEAQRYMARLVAERNAADASTSAASGDQRSVDVPRPAPPAEGEQRDRETDSKDDREL